MFGKLSDLSYTPIYVNIQNTYQYLCADLFILRKNHLHQNTAKPMMTLNYGHKHSKRRTVAASYYLGFLLMI